jgi:CheY-like chemotaxis protein
MDKIKILWVDDEIELLKPHILFLEMKNYHVTSCNNGRDAIEIFEEGDFDIVFLDENMPGMSGLETLSEMKEKKSATPMIMITKSEEEYIMEEAIGSKIADYLIKPVNPNQILLSLKKNLDHSRLISQKTTMDYQKEFRKISMDMAMVNSFEDWIELYKKLIFWELELEDINDHSMIQILESQKVEANSQFGKFIERNYEDWYEPKADKPVLSHNLFRELVVPEITKKDKPILFVVIDNLRYDQWKVFESVVNNHYKLEKEVPYYAILPTATQYARNANAVLNIDSQGGGALTLQADLDKDIDSVTAFPPVGGYASNYSIQTAVGTIISGNNSRLGWGITNYGTGNIYLKFGAGATVTTGVSFNVTGAIITGSSFNLILKGGNTEFDNNGGNFLDFTPKYNGPVSVAAYPGTNIKYISWELV